MRLSDEDVRRIAVAVVNELERRRLNALAIRVDPDDSDHVADPDSPLPADQQRALAAMAHATVARMRGHPGAIEASLRAEAHYRANYDESWQRSLRKHLRRSPQESITDDEMYAFVKARHDRRDESRKRRALAKQVPDGQRPTTNNSPDPAPSTPRRGRARDK